MVKAPAHGGRSPLTRSEASGSSSTACKGCPVVVQRGSATELPLPDGCLDAVVTDPPYDSMINYCDSSDLIVCVAQTGLSHSASRRLV